VSNLSTYVVGALAAVLVMDHASTIASFQPALELLMPAAGIAEPANTVNRARKGDRSMPFGVRRDSRPANAPLEVVDVPTGSTGGQRAIAAPGYPTSNVPAVMKQEVPARDRPGKRALPLGCESAFGRLAAPPLAQVPGRCII
jgi:hypothetical protein